MSLALRYMPMKLKNAEIPKGDELLIKVFLTRGSGPARVWGHVKQTI